MNFTPFQAQLYEAARASLSDQLYKNAAFLAERLLAECNTEEVKVGITKEVGAGEHFKAYYVLNTCASPIGRYKLAQVCLKLKRFRDAERALNQESFSPILNSTSRDPNVLQKVIPNGAAGLFLYAQILETQGKKDCVKFYQKALERNPTLWVAYERLAKLCPNHVNPDHYFSQKNQFMMKLSQLSLHKEKTPQGDVASPVPFFAAPDPIVPSQMEGSSQIKKLSQPIQMPTLTAFQQIEMNDQQETQFRIGPARKPLEGVQEEIIPPDQEFKEEDDEFQHPQEASPEFRDNSMSSGKQQPSATLAPKVQRKFQQRTFTSSKQLGELLATPVEQSMVRQFTIYETPAGQHKRGVASASLNNLSFEAGPARSTVQKLATPGSTRRNLIFSGGSGTGWHQNTTFSEDGMDIIGLFNLLGHSYKLLCSLKCEEAFNALQSLPKRQFRTGWVLLKAAQCFFQQGKYEEAEKYFEEAYRLQPYRVEGYQFYSTCLWQLKKQVLLCQRANMAIELNPFSPSTWMAVGNAFSLQKEHEIAIKFFNRAIQLDKRCAYAYTLCGHEYMSNEDFEQAKRCYERAIKCDEMHFTAYWGLGNIYLKQQHYQKAMKLFQKGIAINSRSSVLMSYLGMTYFEMKRPEQALECFLKAEQTNSKNPLARFQKVKVLNELGRLDQAQAELEHLLKLTPKEPPIHLQLGDLYKKQGNHVKAAHHYKIYLDLDPKDQNHVKAKLEQAHIDPQSPEEYDI